MSRRRSDRDDQDRGEPDSSRHRLPDDWIEQRLNRLWPVHNSAFADLMITLRRQFDGDLDLMLILLIIAIGSETDDWRSLLLETDTSQLRRPKPTTASAISRICGIPRESVRRKLTTLSERGWVQRNGEGHWEVGDAAAKDLLEGSQATVRYFQRIFAAALYD